jgi:hypothetical protein
VCCAELRGVLQHPEPPPPLGHATDFQSFGKGCRIIGRAEFLEAWYGSDDVVTYGTRLDALAIDPAQLIYAIAYNNYIPAAIYFSVVMRY